MLLRCLSNTGIDILMLLLFAQLVLIIIPAWVAVAAHREWKDTFAFYAFAGLIGCCMVCGAGFAILNIIMTDSTRAHLLWGLIALSIACVLFLFTVAVIVLSL